MTQTSGTATPDRFPEVEVMNLLFNFFEDSNEEIMDREQMEEVLWSNVGNAI